MIYALLISNILLISILPSIAGLLSSNTNPLSSLFKNRPILNAYATKSGTIPLQVQGSDILVFVDFSDDSDETSKFSYDTTDSQPMQLALYTSTTLLSAGCFNYTPYDCSNTSCSNDKDNSTISINFPYFNAIGSRGSAQLYLDYSYFSLSSKPLFASSCTSNNSFLNGSGYYGMIGMGTQGSAMNNFKSYRPLFSIHIPVNSTDATLVFKTDLSYAASDTPTTQLQGDSNWHVGGVTAIQMANYSYNISNSLIFDINADTPGFPLDIYNSIINGLQESLDMICTNDTYRPTCTYLGNTPTFPTIFVQIGNQSIPIVPAIYLDSDVSDQSDGSDITLLLKGLDSSLTGESYVVPEYKNYIILDSNVMTYYYTVFDGSSDGNTITLYIANQGSDIMLLYIIMACGGVMGISCFFCCCIACCIGTIKERKIVPEKTQNELLENENKLAVKEDFMYESGTVDSTNYSRQRSQTHDYMGPNILNSYSEDRGEMGESREKPLFSGNIGQILDRKPTSLQVQVEIQMVKTDINAIAKKP